MLDVFEAERIVDSAVRLGAQLRDGLQRLAARVPAIGDVRGLGCMLAIELVRDRTTKEPDGDRAQRVIDRAREDGLLLLKCGPEKNVVRLLPPLNATADEAARALDILEGALS